MACAGSNACRSVTVTEPIRNPSTPDHTMNVTVKPRRFSDANSAS
jgi:hypothetical protein